MVQVLMAHLEVVDMVVMEELVGVLHMEDMEIDLQNMYHLEEAEEGMVEMEAMRDIMVVEAEEDMEDLLLEDLLEYSEIAHLVILEELVEVVDILVEEEVLLAHLLEVEEEGMEMEVMEEIGLIEEEKMEK